MLEKGSNESLLDKIAVGVIRSLLLVVVVVMITGTGVCIFKDEAPPPPLVVACCKIPGCRKATAGAGIPAMKKKVE